MASSPETPTAKESEAYNAYIRGETTLMQVGRMFGVSKVAIFKRIERYRRRMNIDPPQPKYRGPKRPVRFFQLSQFENVT